MKYLFFDIECANCYAGIGKICEFGFLLTDERFQVLDKYSYLINPGKNERFNLTDRRGREGISLTHSNSEYRHRKEFPAYYQRIKALLTQPDTLIFGFALNNDVSFLDYDTKRYSLPLVAFNGYDVQRILMANLKSKSMIGLSRAVESLSDQERKALKGIVHHSSEDDAFMTMLVLKHLCLAQKTTPAGLINACHECRINSLDFLAKEEIRRKQKAGVQLKLKELDALVIRSLPNAKSADWYGKRINPSLAIRKKTEDLAIFLETAKGLDYPVVSRIYQTDFLVIKDEADAKKSAYLKALNPRLKFIYLKDLRDLKD